MQTPDKDKTDFLDTLSDINKSEEIPEDEISKTAEDEDDEKTIPLTAEDKMFSAELLLDHVYRKDVIIPHLSLQL